MSMQLPQHIDQGMALTLFMRSTIPEGLYDWKDGHTEDDDA